MAENQKYSILIVDDEPDIVETISTALDRERFRTTGLSDSKKASELLEQKHFDVLITDLVMPEVNGLELIETLRRTPGDTEIIVLTAHATLDSALRSIKLGIYDYLQKPIEISNLMTRVGHAIEKITLKQENRILQNQLTKSLADIAMLFDVSNVLYQVSDFDMALDMVLDTLTEGLNIPRVAILTNDDLDEKFRIIKCRQINSGLVKEFQIRPGDKINDYLVPEFDFIVFEKSENGIVVNDRAFPVEEAIKQILLLPVIFHDRILGYLLVFLTEDKIEDREDIIKLLQIASVQMGPVLHNLTNPAKKEIKFGNRTYDQMILELIRDRLFEAQAISSPVTFAFLRVVTLETSHDLKIVHEVISSYRETIAKTINAGHDLVWQTLDTAILVLPGADLFTTESVCFNLRQNIENLTVSGRKTFLTLKYSHVSYPQAGDNPREIIGQLWQKLADKMEQVDEKM